MLTTVYMMSVTRLTSSEAVRAVVGDHVETMSRLAEEVEERLADWEWQVAGLVRERLREGSLMVSSIHYKGFCGPKCTLIQVQGQVGSGPLINSTNFLVKSK